MTASSMPPNAMSPNAMMPTGSTLAAGSDAPAAITTPDTLPRPPQHPAGPATTAAVTAGRTLRNFLRSPDLLVVGTIQGAMFLLIFRYVFGGAIDAGPIDYVTFLVPGFVVTGVLFSGTAAAAGVAADASGGAFDRIRSLPVPRAAVLAGRAVADTTLVGWGVLTTTALGFAIGFRLHGPPADALVALGLCFLFGFAFAWVFITIGLFAKSEQAAQGMSLMVFPLAFVSSAYVPTNTMPGWMQPIADHQPITAMIGAVRGLVLGDDATAVLGHSTSYYLVRSLAWTAVLVAVFCPLAVSRFTRN